MNRMREKCFNKNKLNPKIVNARHELYRTMKVVYNFTVISSSKELSVASYIMCTSAVIKTNIRSLFLTTFFMLSGFHNDAWFYKVHACRRHKNFYLGT